MSTLRQLSHAAKFALTCAQLDGELEKPRSRSGWQTRVRVGYALIELGYRDTLARSKELIAFIGEG